MRRFLFLALGMGMLLPTSASAEVIYLRCTGSSEWYPYFEVAIDEAANEVTVYGTKGKQAFLSSSKGNFLIQNYMNSLNDREIININRFNGKFDIDVWNSYRSSIGGKGKGQCTKDQIEKRAF
tara:strand:- start:121 stop:489 length:369 start_codon:yes stop_codon:yes gene_type:complete